MRSWRIYWTPIVVLVLTLVATGLATYSVSLMSRGRDQVRFLTSVRWTRNLVLERLNIYTCGLSGGASLFAVTGVPGRQQFRQYAERLNLHNTYPGIQGFGFARRTLPDEVPALVNTMRGEGSPDFAIQPPGPREEYFPIIYLEPPDKRNLKAIGYDMFSEPVRQEAMARARDEGMPIASGKVILVQEIDPQKQPGFLIYVPVYRGGQIPPTVEERREKLLGFVYSPFRAGDLFAGILNHVELPEVHLQVFDETSVNAADRLYQSPFEPSRAAAFRAPFPLDFAGHRWTLFFQTTPAFDAASYGRLVPWVAAIGALISFVLCAITAALARAHRSLQEAQRELKIHAEGLEKTVAARTARLRETIAELEHMSYSIVHDLRAPLRAIQSFGGLVEEEAGPALSKDCRGYLARMKTAASRMDALIRDVLNYSKIVRDEVPLHVVDVGKLVQGIIETYPSFQPAAAQIHVDPALPSVLGNEGALTQCFSNLLSNAVRYAKPGQKPKIVITGQKQNGLVRICVRDEGVGIPKELQSKVFGMFQRLENTHEGTGMGLAIVRKAAERMGGKVSVDSDVGLGLPFLPGTARGSHGFQSAVLMRSSPVGRTPPLRISHR